MRRLRAHAGLLALLALMAGMAAFLAAAAPRTLNRISDDALRASIAESDWSIRDLTVVSDLTNPDLGTLPGSRNSIESALPPVLGSAVSDRWYAIQSPPRTGLSEVFPEYEGKPPLIDLRVQDGFADAVRVTAGMLPPEPELPPRLGFVDGTVSVETAEALHLDVGSEFRLGGRNGSPDIQVRVTGLFEAKDPAAPIWQDHPQTLHPAIPRAFVSDAPTYLATVVLHPQAWHQMTLLDSQVSFRYRLDQHRLHAGQTAALLSALGTVDAGGHGLPGGYLNTGLDTLLTRFEQERAAALAVVAVVFAGLLGAMLGVLLLAARLGAERRRAEFTLWRARGGSLVRVAGRLTADGALAVLPAVALGMAAALLIPARSAGVPWLAVVAGVVSIAALPAFGVAAVRRTGVAAVRGESALLRPSLRRLTAEATVLLLAVAGVVLLRRRGLVAGTGIDPYLSAVPVLLGLAVALLALRAYPWPLRLANRAAARLAGAVGFLGTAGAGRTTPAAAMPLVVLVVAISVGGFSGVVRSSVAEARDRTAWQEVGADFRLQGVAFERDAAVRALGDVPGVRAVAAATLAPATKLYRPDNASFDMGTAIVLAVDMPAYQKVLAAAGIDYRPHRALREATPGKTLPAVMSSGLSELPDQGQLTLGSQHIRYRVVDTVDVFPGLLSGTSSFLVLPLQALPASGAAQVLATDFLVAGDTADARRLVSVAAGQQRATVARYAERAAERLDDPTVRARADRRAEAEREGMNAALTIGFSAGTAGAAGFALLAVGFTVLVSARSRGRTLSRLRTLGLSQGAARGLVVWETAPMLAVALLAGTALGLALPWLLGPALGLDQFSGGATPRIVVDPLTVSLLTGIVAAVALAAIGWEAAVNRRLNLGGVLRVGDAE